MMYFVASNFIIMTNLLITNEKMEFDFDKGFSIFSIWKIYRSNPSLNTRKPIRRV